MIVMNTSSINFEAAYTSPELRKAADALRTWLEQHPSFDFFTFEQVSQDLASKAPVDQLNRVLLRLTAAHQLDVQYKIRLRRNEYSEETFKTLDDEFPLCVFDSAFEAIEVNDSNKVAVYILPK
jgi:hypothetical protein